MKMTANNHIIFEECLSIGITDLIKKGLLVAGQHRSGIVSWALKGLNVASAYVNVDATESSKVELEYNCGGESIKSIIKLTTLPSNLGLGDVHYFLCPETNARCSKLYLINQTFVSRSACKRGYYRIETQSIRTRRTNRYIRELHKQSAASQSLNRPNFKFTYAGNETKKYKKIMQTLNNRI